MAFSGQIEKGVVIRQEAAFGLEVVEGVEAVQAGAVDERNRRGKADIE
jgi:hypothetical protein